MKKFFLSALLLLAGVAFGAQANAADRAKVDIRTINEDYGFTFFNEFYVVDAQGQIVTEVEAGKSYEIVPVGQCALGTGYYVVSASENISPNLETPIHFAGGDCDNAPFLRFPITIPSSYMSTLHIEVRIYDWQSAR